MKIIAIDNYDGGCGKTTTTVNLAKHLAYMGLSVLCIDLDSKAILTSRAGVTVLTNGIGDMMMKRNTPAFCIQPTEYGWSVIGTTEALAETAAAIQLRSPNHNYLQRTLAKVSGFDVVLLDCGANADILSINAMFAADMLIIPARVDRDAVRDIARMIEIAQVAEDEQPKLLGLVLANVRAGTVNYRERKAEIAALNVPILSEIPNREGVNAESEIFEAYRKLAELVFVEVQRA